MLKIKFDPLKPYGYVTYLRMSDPRQNDRSPDQQDDTIESTRKRLGYPWVRIGSYRDSGKSGKLVLRRNDFQRMLGDIRTEKVRPDLILVDTYARYGRAEELSDIRKVLELEYGVLLLTADSNFADPTTSAGRIMATVDEVRATEDNRIKGHEVLRGKLDAVRLKHWPGGPPPFGLKLDPVYHDVAGRPEFDYSKLIRDMQTDWIIHLQFQKAAETGWGQTRLTQFLNAHPDIPAQYKPFSEYTVGDRLRETLYYGEFQYPRIHKATVNDRTVVTHNSPQEVICVPGFCEAIVPIELWNAANQPRLIRAERLRLAKQEKETTEPEKLIEPMIRGIAIIYLLTGLVICGECGRVMTAGGSSSYRLKSGEERRYVHYVCPGAPGGACPNRQRVPEEWLRQSVVNLLRQRLFGGLKSEGIRMNHKAYEELFQEVRADLERRQRLRPSRVPALEQELGKIQDQKAGWLSSLGTASLSPAARVALQAELNKVTEREQQLSIELDYERATDKCTALAVTPTDVSEALDRLDQILANGNVTLTNVELALHIDKIECFSDGTVRVRTNKLGALHGAQALLEDTEATTAPVNDRPAGSTPKAKSRRLTRRDLRAAEPGDAIRDLAEFASDRNRFAGLPDKWFWVDEFKVPPKQSWAEKNAQEILDYKERLEQSTGKKCTTTMLVAAFKKSRPTILKALRIARARPQQDTRAAVPPQQLAE